MAKYTLPDLPYDYAALEPTFDDATYVGDKMITVRFDAVHERLPEARRRVTRDLLPGNPPSAQEIKAARRAVCP